jgi:hypothetical protein
MHGDRGTLLTAAETPEFIGFEDEPRGAFAAPEQSATATKQRPTICQLRLVAPNIVGFEAPRAFVVHSPSTWPDATNKWVLLSFGVHLTLAVLLFAGGSKPPTVLLPLQPLVFGPSLSDPSGIPNEAQSGDAKAPPLAAPKQDATASRKVPRLNEPINATEHPKYAALLLHPTIRNEYLVYLVRHIGVLPLTLVGERHGVARMDISVREDGAIMHVAIMRGSGYPDIDQKVLEMIASIGRLPPLAQEFRSHGAFDLMLDFGF